MQTKIELNITLPTRESDWFSKQLEKIAIPFDRQWSMTVDEFGPSCELFSAMEKVTGKAKQTRFLMRGSLQQAENFLNQLKQSNHPTGITWAISPVLDCGEL